MVWLPMKRKSAKVWWDTFRGYAILVLDDETMILRRHRPFPTYLIGPLTLCRPSLSWSQGKICSGVIDLHKKRALPWQANSHGSQFSVTVFTGSKPELALTCDDGTWYTPVVSTLCKAISLWDDAMDATSTGVWNIKCEFLIILLPNHTFLTLDPRRLVSWISFPCTSELPVDIKYQATSLPWSISFVVWIELHHTLWQGILLFLAYTSTRTQDGRWQENTNYEVWQWQ